MNTLRQQIDALQTMATRELLERYREVFGCEARTRHRQYLVRKITWRIQALAEGGLSERALRRAKDLAHLADVRLMAPRSGDSQVCQVLAHSPERDPRLPPVGTALVRQYKGQQVRVMILEAGFEYAGKRYDSLSAVARAVAGCQVNGYGFFKLGARREA